MNELRITVSEVGIQAGWETAIIAPGRLWRFRSIQLEKATPGDLVDVMGPSKMLAIVTWERDG